MAGSRRGHWPVVGINAVVAGTVLTLVAVLALVVKPPAPPGIAAFAPRAAKPITKAPQDQAAGFGTRAGQCDPDPTCAGNTPPPSALPSNATSPAAVLRGPAPSGLQCYEGPDGKVTQTFDPQSPPCISTWDDSKGNGGATSPGASGSEIRVALPIRTGAGTSTWPALRPIVDFFNTRFQLYGRRITIVPFGSQQAEQQGTGTFNDPVTQRADANRITQLKVFATTDFIDPVHYSWSLPPFLDVLAKHKIVSINGGEMTPYGTAAALEARAPYAWSYYPTIDQLMRNVATMTCRQLVGKPARHAPDEALRNTTRKFAVLLPSDARIGGPMPGLDSLLQILDGCGVHSPKVVRHERSAADQAPFAAGLRQLADEGVTSLIMLPFPGGVATSPMAQAAQQNYRPEWVNIGWNNYYAAAQLNDPRTETSGAFGVGIWNKFPPLGEEVWYQAYLAAGGDPDVLNTGGLYSAATMVSDFNAFWLDTRMTGPEVTNSKNLNTWRAFCYIGLGRRWTLETWPTTDGFYDGGCR